MTGFGHGSSDSGGTGNEDGSSDSGGTGFGYGSSDSDGTGNEDGSSDSGGSGVQEDDALSELSLLDAEIDGKSISLFFDSELDNSIPSISRFKIKSGTKKCRIESISSSPSEGRIDILLRKAVKEGDEVRLKYRDLKKDQLTGVVQSKDGMIYLLLIALRLKTLPRD